MISNVPEPPLTSMARPTRRDSSRRCKDNKGAIYLEDDNGSIAGCIAGIIPALTEDDILEGYPSRDGKILELYVQPNYRGQQVGFGLMRAMEQYFQQAGCKGCHVDCFAPNVAAHTFYRKLGYVDRLTTLLRVFS